MNLLVRLVVSGAAVYLAAVLVPGIHLEEGILPLLGVLLVFGAVNALIRPLVMSLSCGLIVLTLGLFIFIINALMLLLTAWLAGWLGIGFTVESFVAALWGALIIAVVSFVLSMLLPDRRRARRR